MYAKVKLKSRITGILARGETVTFAVAVKTDLCGEVPAGELVIEIIEARQHPGQQGWFFCGVCTAGSAIGEAVQGHFWTDDPEKSWLTTERALGIVPRVAV